MADPHPVCVGSCPVQDPSVIYGEDNRLEPYDSKNSPRHVVIARSTGALFNSRYIGIDRTNPANARIALVNYGNALNLCREEPFREQPMGAGAFCSGFLVRRNVVATAGHCIQTPKDCEDASFVFGFGYDKKAKDVGLVRSADVYACKKIIQSVSTETTDFALIELDRMVVDREPIPFREKGKIEENAPLVVIGHPCQLPTKIAGGARVRSNSDDTSFVANLDAFAGNSGSLVLNALTGIAEGILVSGETDFVERVLSEKPRKTCLVSRRCKDNKCKGETVTRSTEFAPFVPAK
ncbi:MAG: trypsin-like peptidase domain-containing protein [Deltaproteobacteria bacterium]|nr:trypsin-like peptidase domain-containing protein [Deltaproteobacteria bacterium]